MSELTCNEGLYFRYITMMAKTKFEYDILIESKKDDIDYYFWHLKRKGWFDFVDDFVEPRHKEAGVRIDKESKHPMTIQTNQIVCENTLEILGRIEHMRDMHNVYIQSR